MTKRINLILGKKKSKIKNLQCKYLEMLRSLQLSFPYLRTTDKNNKMEKDNCIQPKTGIIHQNVIM